MRFVWLMERLRGGLIMCCERDVSCLEGLEQGAVVLLVCMGGFRHGLRLRKNEGVGFCDNEELHLRLPIGYAEVTEGSL